jgi:hypothetical protein
MGGVPNQIAMYVHYIKKVSGHWEYEPVNLSLPVPGRVMFHDQREQAVRLGNWKVYRKTPKSPMELV